MLRRVVIAGGAALSLLAAVALFTRFGVHGPLSRDESIYVYGGQWWARGVPFYVSTFDPKTPLSALLAALGAGISGGDGITAIRVVFGVLACATVLAQYWLGRQLWDSAVAGFVGAVVLASFRGFAGDAFGGPDAKTPGICLAVIAMALLARRRWAWAALAGSLAFLDWQPLGVYAVPAVVAAAVAARRRGLAAALAGALAPVAVTVAYYAAKGALPQLVEATVRFPLTGVRRKPMTLADRMRTIEHVVATGYAHTSVLFWVGTALFAALCALRLALGPRDAVVWVALPTFVALVAFSLSDFQGYPDLYPLLPYAALGLGGAAAELARRLGPLRRPAGALAGLAAVALALLCWHWYGGDPDRNHQLDIQRAHGATLARVLGGGALYSLGDPRPLVLTGRRNPGRFIYLGSGIGRWAAAHTPGGLAGWAARIRSADPAVVAFGGGWRGRLRNRMLALLRPGHAARVLDGRLVLLAPAALRRARAAGIALRRGTAAAAAGQATAAAIPRRGGHPPEAHIRRLNGA
jgi:hypothetical protein